MTDFWTMVVNIPNKEPKTFSGNKTITQLLTGVKQYMEGEKKKCQISQNAQE